MSADEIGWLDKLKKVIKNSASGCSFDVLIAQSTTADRKKLSKKISKNFNLGNGEEFNDPLEAAKKLLQREYGDTFLFDDNKQEAVFIPLEFTSKEYEEAFAGVANLNYVEINVELQQTVDKYNNNAEYGWLITHINRHLDSSRGLEISLKQMQENIENDSRYIQMKKEDELVERILKYNYDRVGNLIEHRLYRILKNCTFLNKTVIIHSVTINKQPKGENFENDFILFIPTRKLVVVIESKRTFPDKDNKAKKQLDLSYNMFVEKLQHLEGWQFVPMIFTTKDNTNGHPQVMIPESCTKKLGIIVEKTNEETENQNETKENLRKALEILVFVFHASKKRVTKSNWLDYIEKSIKAVCTKGSIVFYSKEQLQILEEKKLLLIGGYGTGKSFLMQQKVEELMKDDRDQRRILYVISGVKYHSIMFYYQMKKKLENKDNKVKVKTFPDKEIKDILEYVKAPGKNFKAVFIDEFILTEEGASYNCPDCDKELVENLDCFWVAPRDKEQVNILQNNREDCHAGLKCFDLKKFRLTKNMRNSKAVLEFAKRKCPDNVKILLPENLENFPDGKGVQLFDKPIQSINEALKFSPKGILVLVGVMDDRTISEFFSTLTKIENGIGYLEYSSFEYYKDFCKNCEELKPNSSKNEKNCIDFLEVQGNILFVSVECIAGFEWPSVVCIGKFLDTGKADTEHFVNAFLRSTVALYLDKNSNPP